MPRLPLASKNRPRLIRRLLVLSLVVVVAAVAWSLRRPAARPDTPGQAARGETSGTKIGEMFFVRFNEGGRSIEVKAKSTTTDADGTTMHLESVEAKLPFVAEGRPATLTIRADRCDYQPQPPKASFRGHVVVTTDDGMLLETESLEYDSVKSEAEGKELVTFRRGIVSGSSVGLRYRTDSLELFSDVKLRIAREGEAPTEIESGNASASRQENRLYFNDGVVVRQGGREIRSGRLQLNMADQFRVIQQAAAIEDVLVRIGAGAKTPGAGPSQGEKQLRCRRLNVAFNDLGGIREAIGVNPATLDLLPGPADPESRRLTAQRISFTFAPDGKLTDIVAGAGLAPDEVQRTVLTSTAKAGGREVVRRVESKDIAVSVDPASGGIGRARFEGQVVFSEPGRRAWSERAEYEGASGGLLLQGGEPRIVDENDGSELRAKEITVGTRSRDVDARDNVRHTLGRRRSGAGAVSVLGGDEPVVVVAKRLQYDGARRAATYRENVLMRSGRDEIRAPLVVIEELQENRRRLTASGGVTSSLHPRRSLAAKREPAAVLSRSKELVYDEPGNRVVYSGDVEMRQGDIQTVSPEVVVLLGRDQGSVDRVLAGSPVDVRQGARRATGERATYTPADETLVLVGEKVVVNDVDRRLEGRVLTFQVGSDRIRLDGRDEVRTEAVLKRRDPPKP